MDFKGWDFQSARTLSSILAAVLGSSANMAQDWDQHKILHPIEA